MITNRDLQYFDVANSVARLSNHYKTHVGSVLVNGSDILAVGFNTVKSHPIQMKYNRFRNMKNVSGHLHHLHSEIATLIKVKDKKKLKGASLYTVRVKKDNTYGISKPCNACMAYILRETPLRNCFYSTETGIAYEKLYDIM